jgi:spermidine/putrescine transport system ATP-binding protein
MSRDVAVSIRGIHKRFGSQVALESIDLDIYQSEFLSLLGPSGCGKTTLLRIIAGFEQPEAGTVLLDGDDALKYPAYKRPVNTVFQSYALFPHMSVEQNIRYGLKMAGVAKPEMEARAREAMQTVEIEAFAKRKPDQLSGGQRQRVALARAIVNRPKVLLLDEPLSALDLKLRKQLQVELMQLQKQLGITFIYVTHDQEEALVMSDRIAVMRTGAIEQLGEIEDVYEHPKNRYVASFLGSANILEGQVIKKAADRLTVSTALGELEAIGQHRQQVGEALTLAIRPEKIFVNHPDKEVATALYNQVSAVIEEIVYTGVENQYYLRAKGTSIKAYVMNKVLAEHDQFDIGHEVSLLLPKQNMVVLDD